MEPLLLSSDDAAQALGTDRSKLYELLASGDLHSVKLGRCRRIPVATLEQFVATLTEDTLESDAHRYDSQPGRASGAAR